MKKLIILSGGIGSRTKLSYPKQYHEINGKKVINILIDKVANYFDQVIVVADKQYWKMISKPSNLDFISNGSTRLESLQNGLKASNISKDDTIFIHEAARPGVSIKDFELHMSKTVKGVGSISCSPSINTMFIVDENKQIMKVIKKQDIVNGNNPQSFCGKDILDNFDLIFSSHNDEDLAEILLNNGVKINTLPEFGNTRKITTPEDVLWATEFFKGNHE